MELTRTKKTEKSKKPWFGNIENRKTDELRRILEKEYILGDYAKFIQPNVVPNKSDALRLVLIGPPSSGKSSFINTISRVVEDFEDYQPLASVNDEEPGRKPRTFSTHSYEICKKRRENNLEPIEIWDTRGLFSKQPQEDWEIICNIMNGEVGVGEYSWQDVKEQKSWIDRSNVPIAGIIRKRCNLLVFVIHASVDNTDISHLSELCDNCAKEDFQYVVVVTKPDKCGEAKLKTQIKLPNVASNNTYVIQNYQKGEPRNDDIDKLVMMNFLKIILEAEKSLLLKAPTIGPIPVQPIKNLWMKLKQHLQNVQFFTMLVVLVVVIVISKRL